MKSFKEIREGWSQKEFINQTHNVRRKFKDGEVVFIKKGAFVWFNDGWSKNYKKDDAWRDTKVKVIGVNPQKSKANEEIWYDCEGDKQKIGDSYKYIVPEKSLFSESEAEGRGSNFLAVYLYLAKMLGAHGSIQKDGAEVKLTVYQVHRNYTTIDNKTEFSSGGYYLKTSNVAEFFDEKFAENFIEDMKASLKKNTVAPLMMGKKDAPDFTIEKKNLTYGYDEAVELSKTIDPEWSIEKAMEETRGTRLGNSLGLLDT